MQANSNTHVNKKKLRIKKNISFLWVCGQVRSTSRKGKGTALCAAIREGIICKRNHFTGVTANVVQYFGFSIWRGKHVEKKIVDAQFMADW
jgi:hypothetical protein